MKALLRSLTACCGEFFVACIARAIRKAGCAESLGRSVHSANQAWSASRTRRLLKAVQSCGTGVRLNGDVHISHPRSCLLADNVHIGDSCYFYTAGGLTIGANTHISRRVTIYTANHAYNGRRLPYDSSLQLKPVHIGRNVWIGMGVSIVPGVSIGDGAIIGMGTVVTGDVGPGEIVGGQAHRILSRRNPEHYAELVERQAYGGVNGAALAAPCGAAFRDLLTESGRNTFFVASTGRSGTTTLAKMLSQHPGIECRHELRRQLIRVSTELEHRQKHEQAVREELRHIYETARVPAGSLAGEVDQRLFNLCPILFSLMPAAKFVWLTRDGRDVVSSAHARGWFGARDEMELCSTNEQHYSWWSTWRLNAALAGAMPTEQWSAMEPFERNCWYWSYVNRRIQEDFRKIGSANCMRVPLEQLGSTCPELLAFLGAPPRHLPCPRANVTRHTKIPLQEWTSEMKATFTHWCGPLMSELYPGWEARWP